MNCRPPRPSGNPRNGPAEPGTCSACGPPPPGPPCTPRSTSTSPPGSPRTKPRDTSGNTPARPSTPRCAPPSLAGHDLHAVIDRITAAPLDGARSIASVLHGRLQRLHLPDPGIPATWAQRTPASAPPVAHELAEALDARSPELGHRHAASPEPWLIGRLGILPPGASPMQCADYERRAGIAAAYREAAGITNPYQAISPEPHHGNPELEHMRQEVIRELEYPDEAAMWAGMDRGQLEAHTAAAERAQATAPPDVSGELRLTAHAEADARQQAADAQVRNDAAEAASASALTGELAARRQQLEAGNATTRHGLRRPATSGTTATRPPPN